MVTKRKSEKKELDDLREIILSVRGDDIGTSWKRSLCRETLQLENLYFDLIQKIHTNRKDISPTRNVVKSIVTEK